MRHPRPQGATFLSIKYQQSEEEQDRRALLAHLVNTYTLQGFRWNGKPTSIVELAHILKIPQHEIMDLVSQTGTHMGSLASPENIKNTLESIITLSTSYAIEDRGRILQQLDQLLIDQGGKYKPFITAELNKVLKLALESNKNLMETYKTFFTSTNNTTNILNIMGNQEDQDKETITPDQALELINSQGLPAHHSPSLPANPDASAPSEFGNLADELYEEYGMASGQDVRERRSGTEALQPSEVNPGAAKPASLPTDPPDSQEDGGDGRRGIQAEDMDELP